MRHIRPCPTVSLDITPESLAPCLTTMKHLAEPGALAVVRVGTCPRTCGFQKAALTLLH